MKPMSVPRRFVVEHNRGRTSLQFGFGSDNNLSTEVISDPSEVILEAHGKNYVTDKSFDPTNLIKTDKLGVVPTNTTLTIVYRKKWVGECKCICKNCKFSCICQFFV